MSRIEARFTVPASTTLTVTNNGGGPTAVTVAAGSYYMTAFCAYLQTALTAQRAPSTGAWSVSLVAGRVAISMSAGTFSITWTSANLGTLLGHTTITTQTSVTGASQARGVWIPNCPLAIAGDPNMAPRLTDLRQSRSPKGKVIGIGGGNFFYRHTRVRWSAVSRPNVFVYAETTPNTSWERFWIDSQQGQGHTWFTPSSLLNIYDINNVLMGIAANGGAGVAGWYAVGIENFDPRPTVEHWTGLWGIEIPELVAEG